MPLWNDEQVASLKAFQACGFFHPFTYGEGELLIPTSEGWTNAEGKVTQTWAHDWMLDWSWKRNDPLVLMKDSRPTVDQVLESRTWDLTDASDLRILEIELMYAQDSASKKTLIRLINLIHEVDLGAMSPWTSL